MTYRHEVLYLNATRSYIRVNDTWYDTRNDFDQQVGEQFLIGTIEEILTFEEYQTRFPESKTEIGPRASDKTNHGGYIRKASSLISRDGVHSRVVEYAINPQQFTIDKQNFEIND